MILQTSRTYKLSCYSFLHIVFLGAIVVVIVWSLSFQLPVKSLPITTKVVSSNPAHGEVYSMQPYVIKFVNDLR